MNPNNQQQDHTARIRELNDAFRRSLSGGQVMVTRGVVASGQAMQAIAAVRAFEAFSPSNDPHGEHDFGAFDIKGVRHFWKIDYYAPDMRHGSLDPADPAQTVRVLTIMQANEY